MLILEAVNSRHVDVCDTSFAVCISLGLQCHAVTATVKWRRYQGDIEAVSFHASQSPTELASKCLSLADLLSMHAYPGIALVAAQRQPMTIRVLVQVLPWFLDIGFTIMAVAVLIAVMGHILFGDFEVTMATLSSSISGTCCL